MNAFWKLLGAAALWFIGRALIRFALRLMAGGMTRQKVDATLIRYAENTISVLLNIVLAMAILGLFGVETTSFAAFIALAGVAVGTAWGGLLTNFAAGAFLILLKPFKVGDYVSAGGVEGTVHEIGLFVTSIDTPQNVRTYVGNNKLFSDNVQNFTTNPFRRVDLTAPVAHSVDIKRAMAELGMRVRAIPNVLEKPAPDIEIVSYTALGCVLAVRPYCHNDHYWQVYFDSLKAVQEILGSAGYPVPEVKPEINS